MTAEEAARRHEVARHIANGDRITAIEVRNQQAQRVREITQDQALRPEDRTRQSSSNRAPFDGHAHFILAIAGAARRSQTDAGLGPCHYARPPYEDDRGQDHHAGEQVRPGRAPAKSALP